MVETLAWIAATLTLIAWIIAILAIFAMLASTLYSTIKTRKTERKILPPSSGVGYSRLIIDGGDPPKNN